MKREFLINIIFLVFINLLIKPFFIFGIDLSVQNRAPEGDYGQYFALLFLAYIFQIITDFGIQNFNNRYISQYPQLLPKYFPNLLVLKILLSCAYLIIAPLGAWLIFGYGSHEMPLLMILLFNQVLVQLVFFLRSNVSGLGHYRIDSFLSSLDKLLMLLTCGALLWLPFMAPYFSITNFALAQTLALALTALIVLLVLRSKAQFPLKPSWAKNWRAGKPALVFLLKKSLPYALVILLMTAYTRLDAVLLERILPDGKVHADVYAGAYRLLDAANMLGYLFASLLLPMFARLLKSSPDGAAARPLVSLSFKLIWTGSVALAAAVFFSRYHLISLMMPLRSSVYRADVLGLLIWTFVPVSATYIFSTLLTAHERLMQMNRFFVIGIVLDIALNFLLIPHYQALGAAMSTLATQLFIALAMIWLCQRTFSFLPSRQGLLQVFGVAAWIFGIDWLLFKWSNLPWIYAFSLALFAALPALVIFRIADIKQLKGLLKKQEAG